MSQFHFTTCKGRHKTKIFNKLSCETYVSYWFLRFKDDHITRYANIERRRKKNKRKLLPNVPSQVGNSGT